MNTQHTEKKCIAIIGGGPAGLMAAEVLSQAGLCVEVFDAMPSVGRKFLLAGVGGMNITHAEKFSDFCPRYGERAPEITHWLQQFNAEHLREWVHGLGIETFVGSSQRVFPKEMKAAPLLRAWLHRLRERGVVFHTRHRFLGWGNEGELCFSTREGDKKYHANATVLALGGGSWARLGSDGAWVNLLREKNIKVATLRASNCGFVVPWSDFLIQKFVGTPLKSVAAVAINQQPITPPRMGECVISEYGIEGGLIYALSAALRDAGLKNGSVALTLDLAPERSLTRLKKELSAPRGKDSVSSYLRKRVGIDGLKAALLHELLPPAVFQNSHALAENIKALTLTLIATRPIDQAISTAGGVCFEALDENLMIKNLPAVFCAGEMLDWEAPTGGYLLTACFSSGFAAGNGVLRWLKHEC